MSRVWPWLVLVALLAGQPTPVFAQLKAEVKTSVSVKRKTYSEWFGFTPDGQALVVELPQDKVVRGVRLGLLDVSTGKEKTAFFTYQSKLTCTTFNSKGTRFATGSWSNPQRPDVGEGLIKVWDTSNWKQIAVLRTRKSPSSLAFSPDGKTLASVHNENEVRLWDVETGKERAQLTDTEDALGGFMFDKLSFSPNGKLLAAGGLNGQRNYGTFLWDFETEQPRKDAAWFEDAGTPYNFFSPDSKLFITGNQLRETDSGKVKDTFKVGQILALSPNGAALFVRTGKGIDLIALDSRKVLHTFEGVGTPIHFSPDGKTLTAVVVTDKGPQIKTWGLTWEKAPAK